LEREKRKTAFNVNELKNKMSGKFQAL
jgi:hypothetical protein